MKKYSVCYSDREGFDWCIVNEFDRPILHGVGNMPTMSDIVEAANRWSNHLAEPNTAEVARLNIKLAYKGDEVSTLAAEVERLKGEVEAMRQLLAGIIAKVDDFPCPDVGYIHVGLSQAEIERLRAALGGE